MPRFHTVCKVHEILPGQARMFVVDALRIAVFRVSDDFHAIDDDCPHAGASLACGNIDGEVVSCRIHHWRFNIRDGRYLDEVKPCYDVQKHRVRVLGEDVQVEVLSGRGP